MNQLRCLVIAALCLSAGCATPLYHASIRAEKARDPATILAVADAHYVRGEYLSALRMAYVGAEVVPHDLRFALLAGLAYDRGLHRPDLAIPEYERAVALRGWTDLPRRLEDRVHYLKWHQLTARAEDAIGGAMPPPLLGWSAAIYPIQTSELRRTDGIGLSLTALLAMDLAAAGSVAAPDSAYLMVAVANAFATAGTGVSPESLATRSGASQTVVCSLIPDGSGGARAAVRVLNSQGTRHADGQATVSLEDTQTLFDSLRALVGAQLATGPRQAPPPRVVPPHLPLSLYGLSVREHLAGRFDACLKLLDEAVGLAPEARWLSAHRERVAREQSGEKEVEALDRAWRQILSHPDPSGALEPPSI